eukprot:3984324-Prymnesium_polylepis.1
MPHLVHAVLSRPVCRVLVFLNVQTPHVQNGSSALLCIEYRLAFRREYMPCVSLCQAEAVASCCGLPAAAAISSNCFCHELILVSLRRMSLRSSQR